MQPFPQTATPSQNQTSLKSEEVGDLSDYLVRISVRNPNFEPVSRSEAIVWYKIDVKIVGSSLGMVN